MARWLYENQQDLSRDTIRAALVEVAGVTDFDARYDATLEDVKADIALGGSVEIEATPTFVINGVMIKGGLSPQFFEAAIALELERAAEPAL
jgi:protein-disulfide isomerase